MAKTFKEYCDEDIKNAFINTLEFAGMHDLNGVKAAAVVEAFDNQAKIQGNNTGGNYNPNYDGLYRTIVFVHVRTADMDEVPEYDERFTLDGRIFMVVSCSENIGVMTIELGADAI